MIRKKRRIIMKQIMINNKYMDNYNIIMSYNVIYKTNNNKSIIKVVYNNTTLCNNKYK